MQNASLITRRLGILAALLLATPAAVPQQAGTGRYTVEIIVFRAASQAGALTGPASVATDSDDGVEHAAVATRKLGGAASKLKGASGYRVLAHTAWTQMPVGFNSGRGVSAAQLGLARAGITGKVILERRTSLHLRMDLTIEDAGRRYHISELRKDIKLDQAQYFDHPAVGVIAMVSAAN